MGEGCRLVRGSRQADCGGLVRCGSGQWASGAARVERKSAMGQSGRDHDLAELARDREEHEAPHRAPLASAIVMEPLIELILVIAGVIVTAALLPLHTKARVVLGFCGLVLVAVGGALFAFVAYPRETVLFLGAGAVTAGTARGYRQGIAWLTRRAPVAITPSHPASEPGGRS